MKLNHWTIFLFVLSELSAPLAALEEDKTVTEVGLESTMTTASQMGDDDRQIKISELSSLLEHQQQELTFAQKEATMKLYNKFQKAFLPGFLETKRDLLKGSRFKKLNKIILKGDPDINWHFLFSIGNSNNLDIWQMTLKHFYDLESLASCNYYWDGYKSVMPTQYNEPFAQWLKALYQHNSLIFNTLSWQQKLSFFYKRKWGYGLKIDNIVIFSVEDTVRFIGENPGDDLRDYRDNFPIERSFLEFNQVLQKSVQVRDKKKFLRILFEMAMHDIEEVSMREKRVSDFLHYFNLTKDDVLATFFSEDKKYWMPKELTFAYLILIQHAFTKEGEIQDDESYLLDIGKYRRLRATFCVINFISAANNNIYSEKLENLTKEILDGLNISSNDIMLFFSGLSVEMAKEAQGAISLMVKARDIKLKPHMKLCFGSECHLVD